MFEAAELGQRIPKEEYKRRVPKLRAELLDVQQQLTRARFPVIVVFAGVDGAGKGETVNLLNEWMDPRWTSTRAYGKPSDEESERPEYWRYWRDLPPKGRMGLFLSSWYSRPVLDRVNRRKSAAGFDHELDRIAAFERTLTDDGVAILKFWTHLGRQAQKKRLRKLESDPLTRFTPRPPGAALRRFCRESRGRDSSHMRSELTDLPRIVLTVLFLGLLLASVFWVLQPFLGAILWAAMIVVATWPVMRWLEHTLGGRRWLAVTVLTLSVLLVLVVPLFLAIGTLLANTNRIAAWAQGLFAGGLPLAPPWIAGLPIVGPKAADAWNGLANSPLGDLAARLTPYLGELTVWFGGQVGGLGKLLVQFLFTVALSAVFWSSGEEWSRGLVRFAGRLLGSEQGEAIVRLAGQAVRGVALGVVGTALIQALVGGLGLAIAGVPVATVLTVLMFLLGIAQIGPLPVLLSAVAWLFWSESSGMGAFLLTWSVIVGTLDNVVRPILIRKGANLPLLLVFAGVLGGLISFGLIGLFVGPVVLAVAHTLLRAWMEATPSDWAASVR